MIFTRYFPIMYMCGDTHLPGNAIKVRGHLQALFFPFHHECFGIKLRSSGLAGSTLSTEPAHQHSCPFPYWLALCPSSVILYTAMPGVIFYFLFHLFLPSSGTRMLMDHVCVSNCAADIQLSRGSSLVRRPLLKEWLRVRWENDFGL